MTALGKLRSTNTHSLNKMAQMAQRSEEVVETLDEHAVRILHTESCIMGEVSGSFLH